MFDHHAFHKIISITYVYVFSVASNGPTLNDAKFISGVNAIAPPASIRVNSRLIWVKEEIVFRFSFRVFPVLLASTISSLPISRSLLWKTSFFLNHSAVLRDALYSTDKPQYVRGGMQQES